MRISQHDIDIKRENFTTNTDLEQVYALIKRVTNENYATCVVLELTEEKPERFPENKLAEIPTFCVWSKDLNSCDKFLIIDYILTGKLKKE